MAEPPLRDRPRATSGRTVATIAGLDALAAPLQRSSSRSTRCARVLTPVAGLVAVLALWQAASTTGNPPSSRVPAPISVAEQILSLVVRGPGVVLLGTSLGRAGLGFLLSVVVAVLVGGAMMWCSSLRGIVEPHLIGLQSLPSAVWVPASVLVFGPSEVAIYSVIVLGAVPPVVAALMEGVDGIPPTLTRLGAVLGAGRLQALRHILLPAALPACLAGAKQGWAFTWRALMTAELIAGPAGAGLGAYLKAGQTRADLTAVLAGIALTFFVGVVVETALFRPIEARVRTRRGYATERTSA